MIKTQISYTLFFEDYIERNCQQLIDCLLTTMPFLRERKFLRLKDATIRSLSMVIPRPLIKGDFFEIKASKRSVEIILKRMQCFDRDFDMKMIYDLNMFPGKMGLCVARMKYNVVFLKEDDYLIRRLLRNSKNLDSNDWEINFKNRIKIDWTSCIVTESYTPWEKTKDGLLNPYHSVKIEKSFSMALNRGYTPYDLLQFLKAMQHDEENLVWENL